MVDARQRTVLHALGIPMWVPKACNAVPIDDEQLTELSIWRDASTAPATQRQPADVAGTIAPAVDSAVIASAAPTQKKTARVEQLSSTLLAKISSSTALTTDKASAEPTVISATEIDEQAATLDTPPLLQTFTCHLQACEINQWIVLVDERELAQAKSKQLWDNICHALLKNKQQQAHVYYFAWPLSDGQRWQNTVGIKPALSGFLFRLGLDKRIGVMSELDDAVYTDRMERLPTLAELIEAPLKKRMLWNLLK